MNWKAVGLGSGKTYATGTHADCIMAISDGEHVEAIRVMREGEYILSNEEELEVIEEKMRQVKEKKHIQLEIKKAALAEIREQKRIAAEQEEIRIENIRLESIARQQAAKEAAKLTSKPKKEKPERVMPIAKMPAPRKRLKRDAWSSAEEAFVKTNIDMPTKELTAKPAERFGKIVTEKAVTRRKAKLRERYGIPARLKKPWTKEEDDYIVQHYNRMSAGKIGIEIKRTRAAVEARVILLKRGGEFDRGQRYDKEQDYWRVSKSEGSDGVHESGEHQDMGVVDVSETAEKMDTAQIIKPDDMPDESDISAVKIG